MNVGKGQSLPEAAAGCELRTERYLVVRVPWAYCLLHTRRDGEPPRGLTQLGPRAARGQKPNISVAGNTAGEQ